MCSSRGICGGNNRPNRSSSSEGNGSGAHYALCALGVGLIALGIVMIVWTVIPMDGEDSSGSSTMSSNSTAVPDNGDEERTDSTKSSTVAMVLVGVGAALLLLSICLGVRSKRRERNRSSQPAATGVVLMDHVAGQQEESWVMTRLSLVYHFSQVLPISRSTPIWNIWKCMVHKVTALQVFNFFLTWIFKASLFRIWKFLTLVPSCSGISSETNPITNYCPKSNI